MSWAFMKMDIFIINPALLRCDLIWGHKREAWAIMARVVWGHCLASNRWTQIHSVCYGLNSRDFLKLNRKAQNKSRFPFVIFLIAQFGCTLRAPEGQHWHDELQPWTQFSLWAILLIATEFWSGCPIMVLSKSQNKRKRKQEMKSHQGEGEDGHVRC